MWILGLGDRFVERMRKSLEVRARETCECYKQDVTNHSSRKQNSQNAERNADSGTLDHELSEKNKEWAIHVRFWKRTVSLMSQELEQGQIQNQRLIWLRKCEGRRVRLCHGHCSLLQGMTSQAERHKKSVLL